MDSNIFENTDVLKYISLFGNKLQRRHTYYSFIIACKPFYMSLTSKEKDANKIALTKTPYIKEEGVDYDKSHREITQYFINKNNARSAYNYILLNFGAFNWTLPYYQFVRTLYYKYKLDVGIFLRDDALDIYNDIGTYLNNLDNNLKISLEGDLSLTLIELALFYAVENMPDKFNVIWEHISGNERNILMKKILKNKCYDYLHLINRSYISEEELMLKSRNNLVLFEKLTIQLKWKIPKSKFYMFNSEILNFIDDNNLVEDDFINLIKDD
jgi:hypothetical protein